MADARGYGRRAMADPNGIGQRNAVAPDAEDPAITCGSCQIPKGFASSRRSAAAAWDAGEADKPASWKKLLDERVNPRWTNFSWISPATLLDSINDQIAKGVDDVINAERMRWVSARRQARRASGALDPTTEWTFRPVPGAERIVILGDPGEQDASQYAVVRPLLKKAAQCSAQMMVVLSDVIYPAGDVNDYVDGFYRPYEDFPGPIYALPGNHDWYDGLEGFMFHFCGAEPLPPTAHRKTSYRFAERIAHRMWRRSSRPERLMLERYGRRRDAPPEGQLPRQPGPYYVLDTEHVMFVCIDTGVTGGLDPEQGDWLCDVAGAAQAQGTADRQANLRRWQVPLWRDPVGDRREGGPVREVP